MVDTILGSSCHVIATLRTKTAYEVQQENGKNKVNKIGLAPVQRDGLEYEFTLVLDLAIEGHVASATKDRTNLFDGAYFVPTEETGKLLSEWPRYFCIQQPVQDLSRTEQSQETPFLVGQIHRWLEQLGLDSRLDAYTMYACSRYGVSTLEQLTKEEQIKQIALLRQCRESDQKREWFIDILNQ